MSIPTIGGASALPATPVASAAPAASALPFLLPMLATPQATEATMTPLDESPATGEVQAADEAAPLIGWLFDSFAMAAPPTQTAEAATDFSLEPEPGMPAKAPLPTSSVFAELAATVAGPTIDDGATDIAALASAALPDIATQSTSPTPSALPDAIQQNLAAAPVMLPSLPTAAPLTTAAQPAPMDGPVSPLVADAPDFGADLGERIAWQLDQGLGEATIELHPAELGALTIRIETQAQQAQVHIVAVEPAARALLSQCLPQLRELLGASGLTLTRGQVESGERRETIEPGVGVPSPRTGRRRVTSVSLVDTYA